MQFMRIVHMEVQNRHLKPKPGGYFNEKGGLLALCNTNSSLLGKPLSRSSAAAACAAANRPDDAASVTLECNNTIVGGVKATAIRKNSLAVKSASEEVEMVNLRGTPADV